MARSLKKGSVSFIVLLPFAIGGRNGKENNMTQPFLAGMEVLKPEETELDNCLVLSRPEYKDTGKKQEWTCVLHAEPSIFQSDTDMEVTAVASQEIAKHSQKKSLKPGDRVVLTGIMREDRMIFSTGESKSMYRLALTKAPQMIAKEKRVSTTVFEQRQKLR
jgi:hypothetical protein